MSFPKNRLSSLEKSQFSKQRKARKTDSISPKKKARRPQDLSQKPKKLVVVVKAFDQDQPIMINNNSQTMIVDQNQPIELHYDNQSDRYIPVGINHSQAASIVPNLEAETEAFEVEAFALDQQENYPINYPEETQAFPLNYEQEEEVVAFNFEPEARKVDAEVVETNTSETFSNDDFMADLQAILKGEKVYEQKPKETSAFSHESESEFNNPPPQKSSVKSAPTAEILIDKNPHDIFDKIAKNMAYNQISTPPQTSDIEPEISPSSQSIFDNLETSMAYANSFDLGSISLQQTFDKFDKILDQEEAKKQPQKVYNSIRESLAFDDEELAEDLAWMNSISQPENEVQMAIESDKEDSLK